MAFRNKKKEKEEVEVRPVKEKILDVDASMQGSMTFRDPVNLRINGRFEGSLDTKGNLTVGENAQVHANINGEDIVISGKVYGNVNASSSLSLTRTAYLQGDIKTPKLDVTGGAVLQGKCDMSEQAKKISSSTVNEMLMNVEELAKYLEVDANSVVDWAKAGRIPAQKEGNSWRFDRTKVDSWIASERIK
ncbi:MAG: polymer-forming cytoskeletal protein [Candidatus Omnitrophica bacterium]|nr:polymer-forming cytoskeletal protein [Candidatus Omnitrophota bacterium]